MASDFHLRYFLRSNPPLIDLAEDELAGGAPELAEEASATGSNFPVLVPFCGSFSPFVSSSISMQELIQLF